MSTMMARTRMLTLMNQRAQVAQEVELLTSLLNEVERELLNSSRSSLIGTHSVFLHIYIYTIGLPIVATQFPSVFY